MYYDTEQEIKMVAVIDDNSLLHRAENAKEQGYYKEVIKSYEILAEEEPIFYALIGDIYREGRGDVEKNIDKAKRFYSKGDKKGDGYATTKLGELHLENQEYEEAIKLFCKAEKGTVNALAVDHLVWMRRKGMLSIGSKPAKVAEYYINLGR